jgi:hypothetical protein
MANTALVAVAVLALLSVGERACRGLRGLGVRGAAHTTDQPASAWSGNPCNNALYGCHRAIPTPIANTHRGPHPSVAAAGQTLGRPKDRRPAPVSKRQVRRGVLEAAAGGYGGATWEDEYSYGGYSSYGGSHAKPMITSPTIDNSLLVVLNDDSPPPSPFDVEQSASEITAAAADAADADAGSAGPQPKGAAASSADASSSSSSTTAAAGTASVEASAAAAAALADATTSITTFLGSAATSSADGTLSGSSSGSGNGALVVGSDTDSSASIVGTPVAPEGGAQIDVRTTQANGAAGGAAVSALLMAALAALGPLAGLL